MARNSELKSLSLALAEAHELLGRVLAQCCFDHNQSPHEGDMEELRDLIANVVNNAADRRRREEARRGS